MIIKLWKKEIVPLTNDENEYYERQKVCYVCKKQFNTDDDDYDDDDDDDDDDDNKKYHKVRDHYHYTGKFRRAAHNIVI